VRQDGDNSGERYVAKFAEAPTAELEVEAFAAAWAFVQEQRPCAIWYYSPYERTWWRKLQARYPSVCMSEEVEALLGDELSVDLCAIVRGSTEWPTRDHSIKTLAQFLGFQWRDSDPSGAASIEWYHRWVQGRDPAVKQRLMEYNEDDCRATR